MPIYEVVCDQCGQTGEILVAAATDVLVCPHCSGTRIRKLMSPTSTLTGHTKQAVAGPGDTSCCGSSPAHAGCAGPGSCCGKTNL